jgi:NAD+ synthase (glutamine-hydrolysing)
MDLLDHDSFVEENRKALRRLQHAMPPGLGAVIGYVDRSRGAAGKHLANAASLLADGRILHSQAKTLLPAYDVFDESRYFEPAAERRLVDFKGERIGITICEDIWWETESDPAGRYAVDPVRDCLDQGATLLVAPSASPYYRGKPRVRRQLLSSIGSGGGVPVVYVNMVGGNDGLLFDGQSMVTDAGGELVLQCTGFEEQLLVWDSEQPGQPVAPAEDDWPAVERALGMGIADYLRKTHHERVHVSVSGGIDSALVAALAARALGPERVTTFSLPSMYSSDGSKTDAALLCERLGVPMHTIPIEDLYTGYERALAPVFAGAPPDITEENLQARIRGMLMMAYSNKTGSILLATGNKSELATGYSTLYGDLCGGLAPIGDLLKTEVYALSRAINQGGEIIPEATLTKPPSAELRPNQTDQDSLPDYDQLDQILELYVIGNLTRAEIVARGYNDATVADVLRRVGLAEYKRRQAPTILKVSPRAFGTGRRFPIAREIHEVS